MPQLISRLVPPSASEVGLNLGPAWWKEFVAAVDKVVRRYKHFVAAVDSVVRRYKHFVAAVDGFARR